MIVVGAQTMETRRVHPLLHHLRTRPFAMCKTTPFVMVMAALLLVGWTIPWTVPPSDTPAMGPWATAFLTGTGAICLWVMVEVMVLFFRVDLLALGGSRHYVQPMPALPLRIGSRAAIEFSAWLPIFIATWFLLPRCIPARFGWPDLDHGSGATYRDILLSPYHGVLLLAVIAPAMYSRLLTPHPPLHAYVVPVTLPLLLLGVIAIQAGMCSSMPSAAGYGFGSTMLAGIVVPRLHIAGRPATRYLRRTIMDPAAAVLGDTVLARYLQQVFGGAECAREGTSPLQRLRDDMWRGFCKTATEAMAALVLCGVFVAGVLVWLIFSDEGIASATTAILSGLVVFFAVAPILTMVFTGTMPLGYEMYVPSGLAWSTLPLPRITLARTLYLYSLLCVVCTQVWLTLIWLAAQAADARALPLFTYLAWVPVLVGPFVVGQWTKLLLTLRRGRKVPLAMLNAGTLLAVVYASVFLAYLIRSHGVAYPLAILSPALPVGLFLSWRLLRDVPANRRWV